MANMWLVSALLWFAVAVSCDRSPTIFQSPQSVVKLPGESASLACSLEGHSNPSFYWYRQIPGRHLEMLVYSISKDSIQDSEEKPKHIAASRPQDSNFILSITDSRAEDTGTYYCAWSRTLCQSLFLPPEKVLPNMLRGLLSPKPCLPHLIQVADAIGVEMYSEDEREVAVVEKAGLSLLNLAIGTPFHFKADTIKPLLLLVICQVGRMTAQAKGDGSNSSSEGNIHPQANGYPAIHRELPPCSGPW